MTRDPVRLLDDSSLPDLLREDLTEAVNQPLAPMNMALGLASLAAAIHAGGGGAMASSASATAKAAALAHGSWWGGALIGFGAGLVAAAAIWFAPPLSSPPAPSPAPMEAAPPAPMFVKPGANNASRGPLPASPPPRAPSAILAPTPAFTAGPSASAAAEPVDGPAEELALLVRIKQQAAGDPAAVVALVDEGHRRFPHGSFYQERESIAILALAQLGRGGEARARAQRFLVAHPQSPYAERLRGLVAPPP